MKVIFERCRNAGVVFIVNAFVLWTLAIVIESDKLAALGLLSVIFGGMLAGTAGILYYNFGNTKKWEPKEKLQ